MTRYAIRSLALIGLGLSLTACAAHQPARANCFDFSAQDRAAGTGSVSALGADVTRADSPCDFVLLGLPN